MNVPLTLPGARTLVLDLDGTLIDTVPDLAAALNRLMRARGLAGFTLAETAAMVGDGVARLVGRAFVARGRTADAADVAAYSADYSAHAVGRDALALIEHLRAGSAVIVGNSFAAGS